MHLLWCDSPTGCKSSELQRLRVCAPNQGWPQLSMAHPQSIQGCPCTAPHPLLCTWDVQHKLPITPLSLWPLCSLSLVSPTVYPLTCLLPCHHLGLLSLAAATTLLNIYEQQHHHHMHLPGKLKLWHTKVCLPESFPETAVPSVSKTLLFMPSTARMLVFKKKFSHRSEYKT